VHGFADLVRDRRRRIFGCNALAISLADAVQAPPYHTTTSEPICSRQFLA